MSSRTASLASATLAALLLIVSTAHAQWQITTYQGSPEITTMRVADMYFSGARPSRFDATTNTLTMVDLFESGGNGQFTINNPFPGIDNMPAVGDTNDYTARVTGTLAVTTAGPYDFFTDSDDGNRFRLDLNRNGTFEASESIVPDGGLQGTGTPERSPIVTLAAGNYPFEVSFYERGGGASIDAGYRVNGAGTQFVLGNAAGGIGMTGPATVRVVGARVGPLFTNFAAADAVRIPANILATEFHDVFNLTDTGGTGVFPGDVAPPGVGPIPAAGSPNNQDDNDFIVVGNGLLVVPTGGVTGAIFRSNTDDGGRLLIDTNRDGDLTDAGDVVILRDALQGPTNTDSAPVTLAAGQYLVQYSWFERGGGGEGEVSVNLGTGFQLLGLDSAVVAGTSLQVIPEPSAFVLAGLAAIGVVGLIRRRK